MASKKVDKNITVQIVPATIVGSDISKYGKYKYASISVKLNDDEHMRVSYEWANEGVPEFVLDVMKFMQGNANASVEDIKECKDFTDRLKETIK